MFDLDAARAARREALGEAPEFTFGGQTFVLPVEMPYSAALAADAGEVNIFLSMLLGEDAYGEFVSNEPATEDVKALSEWILKEYEGMAAVPDEKAGTATTKKTGKAGKAKASASQD